MDVGRRRKEWKCPRCLRLFNNGWQKHNHQRECESIIADEFTLVEEAVNDNLFAGGDMRPDERGHFAHATGASVGVNDDVEDEFANEEEHDAHANDLTNIAYREKQMHFTQHTARNHVLSPKDQEILLFFQCTMAGNGTSREQKQAVLDYIKGFDTMRTNLLPAKVLTCERRFEKVVILMQFLHKICSLGL
jgi:hypothetical protein